MIKKILNLFKKEDIKTEVSHCSVSILNTLEKNRHLIEDQRIATTIRKGNEILYEYDTSR
ncbi:MAG: hypothetical protein QM532_04345 [Cyanobium sp. MAG06]|nr:hypothetical protein [Cyanobium sp. MAG06]